MVGTQHAASVINKRNPQVVNNYLRIFLIRLQIPTPNYLLTIHH